MRVGSDHFAGDLVPGMQRAADFLANAQEIELADRMDHSELAPFRFRSWEGKRPTRSFGVRYDFVSGRMSVEDPLPPWLLDLRARAAEFAGLVAGDLFHIQLLRYDPGAGINWHRDRPQYEQVVGISLATDAVMRLRQKIGSRIRRSNIHLPRRSIYLLAGEARQSWEHSIAALAETRWSITFRSLSTAGETALAHAGTADPAAA